MVICKYHVIMESVVEQMRNLKMVKYLPVKVSHNSTIIFFKHHPTSDNLLPETR